MHEGSKRAIFAAFLANLGIAIAKFVGFLITGASSMLAESIHSVADTTNHGLLFYGGRQASRDDEPVTPVVARAAQDCDERLIAKGSARAADVLGKPRQLVPHLLHPVHEFRGHVHDVERLAECLFVEDVLPALDDVDVAGKELIGTDRQLEREGTAVKRLIEHLVRKQQDTHSPLFAPAIMPYYQRVLGCGLEEDVVVDLVDQADLLGDRQELGGGQESSGRVLPTDQGFEADDGACAEVEDGLVVRHDLVRRDRSSKVGL